MFQQSSYDGGLALTNPLEMGIAYVYHLFIHEVNRS